MKNKTIENNLIYNWNELATINLIQEEDNQHNLITYPESPLKPSYTPSEVLNKKIFITNNNPIPICENNPFGIFDAFILQIPKKHLIKKPSNYRHNIIQRCGEEIYTELSKEPCLSLCDNLITNSYHLKGVNYLIHSALPKYSTSYSNASLSALHLSLRNALDICLENKYDSIIIGKDIFNPSELFPLNDSIEVVLRTLRCCFDIIGVNFTKIIIAIDDFNIYSNIVKQMKIFFPRNIEEELSHQKYIQPLKHTEYGDLILPLREMIIRQEFSDGNGNSNRNHNHISYLNYNDLENFNFDEDNNINNTKGDKDKIGRVFKEKVDFAKKFYYDNIIKYNENIESIFEEMNFLSFKGTDLQKRQLYFIYLQLIDFNQLDGLDIKNEFLLFAFNYMKMNFQSDKTVSLVVFCKDIEKKNYPSMYIVDTIQKMCLSLSTLEHVDIDKIDLVFFQPSVVFKMYIQLMRIYIPSQIANKMKMYDTYEEINQHFYSEIDEGINQRIHRQFDLNYNKLGEIRQLKLMKEINKFKENYFGSDGLIYNDYSNNENNNKTQENNYK